MNRRILDLRGKDEEELRVRTAKRSGLSLIIFPIKEAYLIYDNKITAAIES